MTSSNGRYSEYNAGNAGNKGGRSRHEEHILSRPSATSQEYEGNTSRSHVSIHNMIEQQSYEDRVGISSNSFDPERRGYTFSRNNNDYRGGGCDNNQRGRYERSNNNNPPSHQNNQRDRSNYGNGSRYDQHQQQYNGGGNQHGGAGAGEDYNRREYHEEARHPDHQQYRPNSGYQRDFPRNSDDNNRRSSRDDDRRYDRSRPPNDRYYNDHRGGGNNNYNQRDDRTYNNNNYNNNNNGGRHDRNNDYRHNQDRSQPSNYRSCSGGNRGGETHSGQQSNEGDGGWETVPQRPDVRQRRAEKRKQKQKLAQEQSAPPQVAFVPPNDSNRNFTQFMLLLTGIPGSGKSTFAESLVTGKPWMYVRVNQDQLGSRRDCEDLTRRVLAEGKCPIIDRCNFDPQQRQHFLNIAATANNCPVDCIVFQVDMECCIQRCQSRQNHETVSPQMARQVVSRMVRDFSPPLANNRINSETFRTLRMISNTDDSFNDVLMEYLNMIIS